MEFGVEYSKVEGGVQMARDFKTLVAWQHAHKLTLAVYRATRSFPNDERFGVTSQVRRAASSVAANLAESSAKSSPADCLRIMEIALGSLRETEYFLLLSHDLCYFDDESYQDLVAVTDETARTLTGLIFSIRQRSAKLTNRNATSHIEISGH